MTDPQTILIVDDDPEWRDFLASVLSDHYAVRLAVTGEAGLRLARQATPTLIVLDVIMPGGMDGFRVLCELRKDPATRAIPVVMLTSVNTLTDSAFDADLLKQYLDTAPSLFLEKPVTPEHLVTEIARVLADAAVA